MGYRELHEAAEQWIEQKLKAEGHTATRERAVNHEVMFDVYDATTNTAYEVLTAKIVRSGHEQDEMILYKLFHYLLLAKHLKFYLVSYGKEELEMFHRLRLEHWHLSSSGWLSEKVGNLTYHKGKTATEIANKIYKALVSFAPLREWTKEDRRKLPGHKKEDVAKRFERINKKLGLPKNFLIGLWRDYRLLWCWRLEYILPLWAKRAKLRSLRKTISLLELIPKKENKEKAKKARFEAAIRKL